MRTTLRKSAYAALTFFGILCVLSVGYSAYSGLASVTAGTPLSVSHWTQIKDNFDDVNSRLSNFSFSSGNVGIGIASPAAKLHVNGPMIRTIARTTSTANDDGTDIGQIVTRILSVNKLGASTALRVTYVDNLRTTGAGKACRWEIRANGASCPAMPLYATFYNQGENLHHTRTFVGYCSGLPAGPHQLQVWVDNAPGYSGSDCYTGWNGATWLMEAEEVN